MVLPTDQISFSDLRKTIGPNDENSISLGQYRPSFPPAHGKGIIGVTDTDIAMSQFRGKSKLNKGFTFRAFQGSAYTFTAGDGGAAGTRSDNQGPGGGGGGILVNGGGGGGDGEKATIGTTNLGGGGGRGYGAGGGGATSHTLRGVWQRSNAVGSGAGGFVYLYLNGSELFALSSTTYTCISSGTLQFIMIGSGANGAPATGVFNTPTRGVSGSGGNAGSLNYGNINVISETTVTISISGAGGTTIMVVNGITYSAAGGNGGVSMGGGISTAGGNAGSGSQGLSYVNNAINSISVGGGYFADNISLFNTYNAFATGTITDMTNIANATNNTYTVNGGAANFSVEWIGKFYPIITGDYTFYLNSDDASYFWIGANAMSEYTTANADIKNGGIHDLVPISSTVRLTGGTLYPMRIQYGQSTGNYDCQFSFEGPGISLTNNFDGYIFN